MANFDPDKMTYAELDTLALKSDLCRGCEHKEVCPIPADLTRRAGWFLSIATCGYFKKAKS